MKLKIYQVDAFAESVFGGNPAAVCPLENWLSDEMMQNIALENNLSETAFYVKKDDQYEIRWFTPFIEVDLCGHATLATSYVLFRHEGHEGNLIRFFSPRSGELSVTLDGELMTMNFPADPPQPIELTDTIRAGFDPAPSLAFKARSDYMLVFEKEEDISGITPHFERIAEMGARGVIITAKGNSVDFVSRWFGPQTGINEDPVTGSAHTVMTPFWAEKLGKKVLTARQLSPRGGYLACRYLEDRVEISGKAKLYMIGEIFF